MINIFQSPVVESESLASIDQADPPLSLTEKHLSHVHVFTGLKIHHHISISECKYTFLAVSSLVALEITSLLWLNGRASGLATRRS